MCTFKDGFFDLNLKTIIQIKTKGEGCVSNPVDFIFVISNDVAAIFTFLQHRAGGAGPTTPTLVGPKILSFMVKALYFQSSGQTNNCQIEVLYKWLDQSSTPSATPAALAL